MNETDDPIIRELEQRLSARASDIDLPADQAGRARRGARRRVAKRAAIAGVPSLLIAAVAVTLVASGGGSGSGSAVDAAFIAEHVSQSLSDESNGVSQESVYEHYLPQGGHHEITRQSMSWTYTDPTSHVTRSYDRETDGEGRVISVIQTTSPSHGPSRSLTVSPRRRTWYRSSFRQSHSGSEALPNLTGRQLKRAVSQRQFARQGDATVGGRRTLKLRLTAPSFAKSLSVTLYVDAKTFQVVESIELERGNHYHGTFQTVYLTPTAVNRAKAERALAPPAGYRQIADPVIALERNRDKREIAYYEKRLREHLSPSVRHDIETTLAAEKRDLRRLK